MYTHGVGNYPAKPLSANLPAAPSPISAQDCTQRNTPLFCLVGREVTLVLRDAVERIIGEPLAADEAAERNGVEFTSENAVRVNSAYVDLHRGVILASNELVRGGAAHADRDWNQVLNIAIRNAHGEPLHVGPRETEESNKERKALEIVQVAARVVICSHGVACETHHFRGM